jgi:predicted phage tail protein
MTTIRLHGVLGQEFGKCFKGEISKPKEAFSLIEANRPKFKKRILELHKKGFNYTVVVDGKKISNSSELEIAKKSSVVDIVPLISGSGPLAPILVAVAVAVVLALVAVAIALLLAPKPPEPPDISVTARGFEQSFIFANKANVAAQGVPVPVGYGRLRVGTQVVQACIKSFPRNQVPKDIISTNGYDQVSPYSYAKGTII